jgi:capsular polysaccharide transport system ATP-binding protein
MIEMRQVSKKYQTRHGNTTVLDGVDLLVQPGAKLGILGRNGAGKSTLIRLLSGAELPTTGTVVRGMSVSWPLAFSGGFQGSLTGLDNLRFIARVYGLQPTNLVPFVEDFSELGIKLREPLKTYSTGMRAKFAFALSMAIEFDCYLIDEVIAVGDARFRAKCEQELFAKRRDRAMLIVSHAADQIREHCEVIYVMDEGRLKKVNDLDEAYAIYG